MCTLSWERRGSHLDLWFNRDEQKGREIAIPPREHTSGNRVRFLAPIDPKGGGTWLAANEAGFVVALLNRWHEKVAEQAEKSRGKLVMDLAGRVSWPWEIRAKDLQGYAPLTLVAFSSKQQLLWQWDGVRCWQEDVPAMLTSSGYRFEEVKAAREAVFESGWRGEALHAIPGEEASPYTVRMNRPDAQTWSRSRIQVREERVRWDYWAEEQDLRGPAQRTTVELAR